MVADINRLEEAKLVRFLFGVERIPLEPVKPQQRHPEPRRRPRPLQPRETRLPRRDRLGGNLARAHGAGGADGAVATLLISS